MSIHPEIEVELDGRRPSRVRYRGSWMPVRRVIEAWVEQSRWWATEERRECLRMEVSGGGRSPSLTLDVYRTGEHWHLTRVHD